MLRFCVSIALAMLISSTGLADEGGVEDGPKKVGGMSIVGNDEAPKSLAIVPWKESQVGDSLDFSTTLGAGREPVDKEVFSRALDYYKIRVTAE
jgi:hypothetical protein